MGVRSDKDRTRDTHMRSREFAQKRRRRSDAPLRYHQDYARRREGEINILDCSKLGEDGAGLQRWTDIPDVFFV